MTSYDRNASGVDHIDRHLGLTTEEAERWPSLASVTPLRYIPAGPDFEPWPKIPRLFRDAFITEKIDGTNAAVVIQEMPFGAGVNLAEDYPEAIASVVGGPGEDGIPLAERFVYAQSRKRFITPDSDNYGFAAWVKAHAVELAQDLGPGRHFGEWYGQGIQRGYGLDHRRFALFNTKRWDAENVPDCCEVVPILAVAPFDTGLVDSVTDLLRVHGSQAVPGYMRPEGVVVYHVASGQTFKALLKNDGQPKGTAESVIRKDAA